jgi:CMP-N-acetylneuraminic acid synthetase
MAEYGFVAFCSGSKIATPPQASSSAWSSKNVTLEKLLIVVPARKGSKRLPGKNLKIFKGKPLYLRALEQALAVRKQSIVVFSTDYSRQELELPKNVVFDERPLNLASDRASSQDLARYLLTCYGKDCSAMLYLQATSPLRSFQDIEDVLAGPWERGIVSCFKGEGAYPVYLCENGCLTRENTGRKVCLNGAIYLVPKDRIESGEWIEGAGAFLMPKSRSVDIDTLEDWQNFLEKNI